MLQGDEMDEGLVHQIRRCTGLPKWPAVALAWTFPQDTHLAEAARCSGVIDGRLVIIVDKMKLYVWSISNDEVNDVMRKPAFYTLFIGKSSFKETLMGEFFFLSL